MHYLWYLHISGDSDTDPSLFCFLKEPAEHKFAESPDRNDVLCFQYTTIPVILSAIDKYFSGPEQLRALGAGQLVRLGDNCVTPVGTDHKFFFQELRCSLFGTDLCHLSGHGRMPHLRNVVRQISSHGILAEHITDGIPDNNITKNIPLYSEVHQCAEEIPVA